jgi:5S rRNA maturation endonuclease (ribonuclease M5)
MSSPQRDAWPEFERLWLRLLRELDGPETVILVEGSRDRRSLEGLGIHAPIRIVHAGTSLADVAASLSQRAQRVVVLTDWDRAGGQLAHRLEQLAKDGRRRVDLETRRELARALRGEIVHVEGLLRWAERKVQQFGFSLDEWLLAAGDGRRASPTG